MKSVLSLISTQDLSKKFGRETLNYFKSTFNVHKSLKKCINTNESDFQAAVLDLLVQLFLIRVNYVIANSVQIEDDKWKRLSRQIVDLLLAHLQSQ
ncbi:unnamed protein product, partial [Rotaria sp. Silwood1]